MTSHTVDALRGAHTVCEVVAQFRRTAPAALCAPVLLAAVVLVGDESLLFAPLLLVVPYFGAAVDLAMLCRLHLGEVPVR